MITTKNTITMADKKVKSKDDVTVYGTGTSKFFPAGEARTMHRTAAETLVKQGRASYDEVAKEPATKTKGGKV